MVEHLFIDFANSELYDGRGNVEDRLLDHSWRRSFLEKWGLVRFGPIDESAIDELVELRSSIRSIAERLRVGRMPSNRSLEYLNAALAASPVTFELSGHGDRVELGAIPVTGRAPTIVAAEIAMSAARFLADGETDRLKMCDNAGCRWVFHDDTKNRSRRWCGPCGNVDKVRRFRERHRLEQGRT